jgi:tetratricopeptide (TPR) repeat protein
VPGYPTGSYPSLNYDRGVALAWLGRWAEADTAFVTDRWRPKDTDSSFYHALLRLQLGDLDGYRGSCEWMLDRYGGNPDFATAHRLCCACVLAPEAVANLDRLVSLGDRVAAGAPRSGHFHEIAAATYYRAGRYEQALECLEKAARLQQDRQLAAYGSLWRALSHDGLGHREEARRWLDSAVSRIERDVPERIDEPSRDPALDWDMRLTLLLLRREARAQIQEGRPLYLPVHVFQDDPAAAHPPGPPGKPRAPGPNTSPAMP